MLAIHGTCKKNKERKKKCIAQACKIIKGIWVFFIGRNHKIDPRLGINKAIMMMMAMVVMMMIDTCPTNKKCLPGPQRSSCEP